MAEYYDVCPFPKPGTRTKKKLHNGYKNKPSRVCRYCGATGAERHEIFGGANRQVSIREGFQIDVCSGHHRELQDNLTEWAQEENRRLRRHFEVAYIKSCIENGMTARQALTNWMTLIGKNYVDEFTPE